MSKFNPTPDQIKMLESNNKNLLVSASAGSGKTATLIEKIYDLVINKEINLDNILVITFTENASSEMKVRLKKRFYECGNSPRVREQIDKLNSSYICTLHALCSKLLKKYFYILDLNPNFAVLSEENAKFLKVKALEKTFEIYDNKNDEDFVNLSQIFGGRNFLNFKKAILAYYDFLCSIINKEEFVRGRYKYCYEENLNENFSCKILNDYMLDNFYYYKKSFEDFLIKAEESKANYFIFFINEVINKLNAFKYKNSFLQNRKVLINLVLNKITQKKLGEEDRIFKEEFKDFYKEFLDKRDEIFNSTFCLESEEEIVENLKNSKYFLDKFNEVGLVFEENYSSLKQKKNYLDFNDLEKFLLKLFENENVLNELNNTFKYIFVDEYQDINEIQEKILKMLSKSASMVMVGDVKQSIYGFRNSSPNIFIDKSLKFSQNNKEGQLVLLNDNFRSKKEILNFVNSIFSKIMVTNFGGVDYKEKSLLKGLSTFEEDKNFPTIKLCLVDTAKQEEESKESFKGVYSVLEDKNSYGRILNQERKEAMLIAKNIIDLVNNQKYYDAKEKGFKNVTYKDIFILARSNDFLKDICKVLEEYKIPISTNQVENIFLNSDVNVLISLLKVISSSHDDISLCTVLVSLFGGLSYENLSQIKKEFFDENYFYKSVLKYAKEGKNETIKNKLVEFFNLVNLLRNKIYSNYSIYDIFMYLDENFNFLTEFASLPGGQERKQTITSFINSFNGTEYNYDLEKYLNYVENFEQDNKFVNSLNNSENSVKVGTIHSSKGLEYPIVILCGLDKRFSIQTFLSPIIRDSKLGLSVSSYNLNTFTKQENLAKSAFLVEVRKKEKAEELRLLYVALTRAKNNLILISHFNSKSIKMVKNYNDAQNCNSYLPWVLSGLSELGFNFIKNGSKNFVDKNKNFEVCVEVRDREDFVFNNNLNKDIDFLFKKQEESNLIKKYLNVQVYNNNNISLKNTVSSMLREYAKEENSSFVTEPKKLTIFENSIDKSVLGTVYHKIMESVDFFRKDCSNIEYLQSLLDNLNLDEKYLKEVNLKSIQICVENIKNFEIYQVYKEQQFLSYIKYCDIFNNSKIQDKVLIQGVVDLIVKTKKEVYIIDYKTNNVKNSDQLVEKYRLQLKLYKYCIEKAMNIKVDKALIYSFFLNKFIEVDWNFLKNL